MTEHKEIKGIRRYKSLYLGLLYNILIGLLVAVIVYFAILLPANYIVRRYYVTDEMSAQRRGEYIVDLQNFVLKGKIDLETTDRIADWVRSNPYVYLLVYQSPYGESEYAGGQNIAPSAKDKLSELSGSRIDESLDRDTLIAEARSYGYSEITLLDGRVIVAITEYTENLYYTVIAGVSVLAAGLSFVLMLVRYIRVIIERIKRFASDVTIVSEVDMNYEIISDGADEIAGLSKNVEIMRQTMLDHIKNEQEAREANTELITSISHDIRTPLTVLMGYIEMMKNRGGFDETMQSYIDATESTALRLKQLSDDMFKYSLAFGDTEKSVRLEEYDAKTLFDQMFTEHILLMRENGYDIIVENTGDQIEPGSIIRTDAQNLMRIVDNVFSNMGKYAEISKPIYITTNLKKGRLTIECKNSLRQDTKGAESNGIGLKTCVRLASLVAERFEYEKGEGSFACRLFIKITKPSQKSEDTSKNKENR